MILSGPILDKHIRETYIQASVDRYSRYFHAKLYYNCDIDTAKNFLEKYIKFHGIPLNIRCEQAQALKSKQSEIICTDNNIKLE